MMPRILLIHMFLLLSFLISSVASCSYPEVKPKAATGAHTGARAKGPVPVKVIAFNDLHTFREDVPSILDGHDARRVLQT